MNTKTIALFYQFLPPYPIAASLRGKSFIEGLSSHTKFSKFSILAYTATPAPTNLNGVSVISLGVKEVENTESIPKRLIGELKIGIKACYSIFISNSLPSLIIISSPSYLSTLILVFFSKLLGIPFVLDIRDLYPQAYYESGLISKKSYSYKILSFLSSLIYQKALLVITATKGLSFNVRCVSKKTPVSYIYNGYPQNLSKYLGSKHSRFTVCFHGVLGFFQDIDSLIKLTRKLCFFDIDVIVIGFGRKENLLKEADLPNLKFRGRLSYDKTITEVSKCHVGLCLRYDGGISRDSFPVKIWECIGLCVPVLVTPHCEGGKFLESKNCGIQFCSGDIEAIFRAILKLKNDKQYYESLVKNCLKERSGYTRESLGYKFAEKLSKFVF